MAVGWLNMGPWYWVSILTGNSWDMSNQYDIWVCLKAGYTLYPEVIDDKPLHLGVPYIRQTHVEKINQSFSMPVDPRHGPATTCFLDMCFSSTSTSRKRTCHESRWLDEFPDLDRFCGVPTRAKDMSQIAIVVIPSRPEQPEKDQYMRYIQSLKIVEKSWPCLKPPIHNAFATPGGRRSPHQWWAPSTGFGCGSTLYEIWCFPEIGLPHFIIHLSRDFPYKQLHKPSIMGILHFRKPPCKPVSSTAPQVSSDFPSFHRAAPVRQVFTGSTWRQLTISGKISGIPDRTGL